VSLQSRGSGDFAESVGLKRYKRVIEFSRSNSPDQYRAMRLHANTVIVSLDQYADLPSCSSLARYVSRAGTMMLSAANWPVAGAEPSSTTRAGCDNAVVNDAGTR
jgi:hypothetical protein